MIDPYIENFLRIIRQFRYDNTYKLVWSKSIIKLCIEDKSESITLVDIAKNIIPLYWNLHIHFDPTGKTLKQGNNHSKPPEILRITLKAIDQYKKIKGTSYKPIFFEQLSYKDISTLDLNYKKVASILNQDVAHRFLNLNGNVLNLYQFNKGDDAILIDKTNVELITNYADVLAEAIQLRWIKILEDINSTTPRIAAKVSLSFNKDKRRSSLKPFRFWLDIENPKHLCNVCHTHISDDELSIDHVIPWSFLYEDNLWNLVYCHKSCNSSKSNITPDSKQVDTLEQRNKRLLNLIKSDLALTNKKQFKELKAAIDDNLLNKMWTLYRGY